MTSSPSIARLKVTLDDVEPAVVRRLEVPLDLRLDRLHLVLQAALGWTNSHLWEVRTRDLGWGIPDPAWDRGSGPLDARKATLLKVIEDTGARTLTYGQVDEPARHGHVGDVHGPHLVGTLDRQKAGVRFVAADDRGVSLQAGPYRISNESARFCSAEEVRKELLDGRDH